MSPSKRVALCGSFVVRDRVYAAASGMARIRTIKPEFWEDEGIGNCSPQARLLFLGLISHADDEGRMRGGLRLLRRLVFAYDDVDVEDIENWLGELERIRAIVRYEVDAQCYLLVRNWTKHQRVEKPKPSALPGPEGAGGNLPEESRRDKEGDKDKEGDQEGENDTVGRVFAYWRETCHHETARLSGDRRAKIAARIKEGRTLDELKRAIDGAAVGAYVNDKGHRFDDIELICRNGSKLESFIGRAGAEPPRQVSSAADHVARLNAQADAQDNE